jgi:C-terminal processing protease CtpA/Prc
VKELNDPYSELLTPKDVKQFDSRTGGRYGGLGMLIQPKPDGGVEVVTVYPNTPAERAGIREGDRIIRADTSSTQGWTTTQVSITHGYYVFDTLYGIDHTQTPRPQMAESASVSDDGRSQRER